MRLFQCVIKIENIDNVNHWINGIGGNSTD